MSNESLLKGNFEPLRAVVKDEEKPDFQAEFRKKALESLGGSMVYTERQQLYWNGDDTK